MQWRLHEDNFRGAGTYNFGDWKLTVDERGVFEFEGEAPLYAIASIVGGKRDRPYVGTGIVKRTWRWLRG